MAKTRGAGGAKQVPPNIQAYRGPNHVLVSRRSSMPALRARVRKLLASERWHEVHLHGLGAALAPTIVLAAGLVAESGGRLVASSTTSTELLVDRDDSGEEDGTLRYNSAIHVRLGSV